MTLSSISGALDAIDFLVRETAEEANRLAGLSGQFDRIGAGTGVGIRLATLQEARAAVVDFALNRAEEAKANGNIGRGYAKRRDDAVAAAQADSATAIVCLRDGRYGPAAVLLREAARAAERASIEQQHGQMARRGAA